MSVIVIVEVASEDFALGRALVSNGAGDVPVRLEQVVPLGSAFVPYLWVPTDAVERIQRVLRAEPVVDAVRVVDTTDGESLLRVDWDETVDGLFDAVTGSAASLLEAVGEGDAWRLRLRFPDHEALTDFHRECAARGISIEARSIHHPGAPRTAEAGSPLTDKQHEALVAALEAGYFDVPRRINLTELAAELDVSDSAVSQRLRRGIASLLARHLVESG